MEHLMTEETNAGVEETIRKAYHLGQRDAVVSLRQNIDDLFEQILKQANERVKDSANA